MDPVFWLRRIRYIVLGSSIALAAAVYLFWRQALPESSLQTIRITQTYAWLAFIYLYLALLPSPLYAVFSALPLRALVVKARRAVGVSSFLFAVLHASFAFFGLFSGFAGLILVGPSYRRAFLLGFLALIILGMLAATSFDQAVVRLGRNWKRLHRLVYAAGILVLVHSLSIGSHLADSFSGIFQFYLSAVLFLLVLEAIRLNRFVLRRSAWVQRHQVFYYCLLGVVGAALIYILDVLDALSFLSIHGHI